MSIPITFYLRSQGLLLVPLLQRLRFTCKKAIFQAVRSLLISRYFSDIGISRITTVYITVELLVVRSLAVSLDQQIETQTCVAQWSPGTKSTHTQTVTDANRDKSTSVSSQARSVVVFTYKSSARSAVVHDSDIFFLC